MAFDWQNIPLSELRKHAVRSFREGGGSRPDVLLIEMDGHQAILKDQSAADRLFALLIGPILNWRETKALKRLASVESIPNLLAVPSSRSFLMSYHESEPVTRQSNSAPDWPVFFAKLKTAIEQTHAAGVAHNDLRNPTNILVTKTGDVVLVDLVACFCQGQKWNIVNRWMFHKFSQVDLSAITKLKTKVAPKLLDESDVHAENIAGRPGMVVKGFGQLIRKISRLIFTSKN